MNSSDPKTKFTTEDKLQFEVEKLREEIRNFKKPFWHNPIGLIALTTVFISIGTIFFNVYNGILENKLAKIENSELRNLRSKLKKESDSLHEAKTILVRETSKQNMIKTVLKKEIDSIILVLKKIEKSKSETEKTLLTEDLTNKLKRSAFKQNSSVNIENAIKKEKEGYRHLINGKFDLALLSFTESENAYNGYKNSYELAKLIMNDKGATDGNTVDQKKVIQEIVTKYIAFIPEEYKKEIREIAR